MIEDRESTGSGNSGGGLVSQSLEGHEAAWSTVAFPPNLSIVGTVNMDETTHGFSRKVLDRAFTLEFSEVDLSTWQAMNNAPAVASVRWPISAWAPRASRLGLLIDADEEERATIGKCIQLLVELNAILVQGQLQIGYRTRDEVALFVLNAKREAASFRRKHTPVEPLDLAILMKILPRIQGGSNAIRQIVAQLLAKTSAAASTREEDIEETVRAWGNSGRPTFLDGKPFPLTAARLCLMWERLQSEGYTSFWL